MLARSLTQTQSFIRDSMNRLSSAADSWNRQQSLRRSGTNALVKFQCNICSTRSMAPIGSLTREEPTCQGCGSTVRMRTVIHVLSEELFGRSLALADFPHRPDYSGIGLSDWEVYARRLAEKLSY